jgi:hypothetical protein
MSETPKFTVIDRRKFKAEDDDGSAPTPAAEPAAKTEVSAGPQLVVNGNKPEPEAETVHEDSLGAGSQEGVPPAPTAEESDRQKAAYEAAAQRLEDLLRAQNPGMGAPPPITFEHLVQQFYVSAMIQMGAGAQDGQRPRVDIVGARNTIDLLGVLAAKTRDNLTDAEIKTLDSVLFEVRMAFLELTSMISVQAMQPPTPPPPGRR